MTAASGLYNVIRQVFGSIGIALAATILTQGENLNRAVLVKHVTPFRDVAAGSLNALASYLSSHGIDPVTAKTMALKILEGLVMRQASMLSYNHIFSLIAVILVLSIPLIFLIRDARMDASHEEVIPE
jgi:DHA2 family multidrug resistance protein